MILGYLKWEGWIRGFESFSKSWLSSQSSNLSLYGLAPWLLLSLTTNQLKTALSQPIKSYLTHGSKFAVTDSLSAQVVSYRLHVGENFYQLKFCHHVQHVPNVVLWRAGFPVATRNDGVWYTRDGFKFQRSFIPRTESLYFTRYSESNETRTKRRLYKSWRPHQSAVATKCLDSDGEKSKQPR